MDFVNLAAAFVERDTANNATISPFRICLANPNLAECENVRSFYEYRISLPANATFLALFSLSCIGFIATYAVTRRGLAFMIAMLLGVICEILGYAGRVMSWKNQWQENGFLIQICCLTIGPAFLAAGIYLCLRRIVYAFGPQNSRIPPEWYTRLFIPCDVISLVLQATGGAMASIASHNNESVDMGDNIMIAGLAFQVFTLLVFIIVSIDFTLNVLRRHKELGEAAFDQSAEVHRVRNSWLFKGFIFALGLSTICIFWRSVFRVAELSQGWTGPLMKRQDLFIGFEGVMIIVACLVLNFFHPAFCIKPLLEGAGGLGTKKKAAKTTMTTATEESGKVESLSDGTSNK